MKPLADQIAEELGLTRRFVLSLGRSASHHYKTYEIAKRAGGTRTIHHPAKTLKAVQRWLLRAIINQLPMHEAAKAYLKGSTTADNARTHVGSRFLLRMDFANFFPSITGDDIRNYSTLNGAHFPQWTTGDIQLFCQLVTRNDALTIGAPTSPGLSNALCFQLDERLTELAARHDAAYSRYADDLFFSTDTPQSLGLLEPQVQPICQTINYPCNLHINSAKSRHSSRRGRRRVTGIVLGSDGQIYVGRHVKRAIRSQIYRYDQLDGKRRLSLAGWIAYVMSIDPDFINSLIVKYGAIRVRAARGLS